MRLETRGHHVLDHGGPDGGDSALPLRRSLALGWRCGEGAAAVGGPDGVSVDFGHIPGTLLRLGIVPILSAAFGCVFLPRLVRKSPLRNLLARRTVTRGVRLLGLGLLTSDGLIISSGFVHCVTLVAEL